MDVYILLAWSTVLMGGSPLVVDVGYGAYAWTALEMLVRWQTINPKLRLLGIEIDPERVANALPYADPPHVDFKLGGFNLVLGGEKARVIRAYNVLRQYEESAVLDALHTLSASLEQGGILIEGTSTPTGGLVAFDIYRHPLQHQALVFGTNFHQPINPTHFQAILPKRLIHHMTDETPAAFFDTWRQALARVRHYANPRRQWIEAGNLLAVHYPIDTRPSILRRGFLVVKTSLL